MGDCLQWLHFHVGSQIGYIRNLKSAFVEAARIYVDLYRRGAGLQYLDVGGGLGVDYDGSQTDSQSSMNYTMQEYANDVLFHVQSVCDDAKVPHWTNNGEGSAFVGHHDRMGLRDDAPSKSWNASHPSRGCSQQALRSSGGDGLFYCFVPN